MWKFILCIASVAILCLNLGSDGLKLRSGLPLPQGVDAWICIQGGHDEFFHCRMQTVYTTQHSRTLHLSNYTNVWDFRNFTDLSQVQMFELKNPESTLAATHSAHEVLLTQLLILTHWLQTIKFCLTWTQAQSLLLSAQRPYQRPLKENSSTTNTFAVVETVFFRPTPPRLSPGRYTSFYLPEIELICMKSHKRELVWTFT